MGVILGGAIREGFSVEVTFSQKPRIEKVIPVDPWGSRIPNQCKDARAETRLRVWG